MTCGFCFFNACTVRWRSLLPFPVAVPDIFLGFEKPSSAVDRCHSLSSLALPLAALASLPARYRYCILYRTETFFHSGAKAPRVGYIGEGVCNCGSNFLAPPLCRILWVLSWRTKTVPPPAGDTHLIMLKLLYFIPLLASRRG